MGDPFMMIILALLLVVAAALMIPPGPGSPLPEASKSH
jgi:hypothetical protein